MRAEFFQFPSVVLGRNFWRFITLLTIIQQIARPEKSQAQINVLKGEFVKIHTDIDPWLRRRYSSRSVYDGLFGLGWCSPWDSRITHMSFASVTLHDCQKGIAVFQRDKLSVGHSYNSKDSSDLLERTTNAFVLHQSDGSRRSYNLQGQLIAIKSSKGHDSTLIYEASGLLMAITIDTKAILAITRFAAPHIKELRLRERTISYQYEGSLLANVRHNGDYAYSYRYDDLANLIEIRTSTNQRERVNYDNTNDTALTFEAANGCIQKAQYRRISSLHSEHVHLQESQSCGTQATTTIYGLEFDKSENIERLVRLNIASLTGTYFAEFDSRSGKPSRVVISGEVFPQGRDQ